MPLGLVVAIDPGAPGFAMAVGDEVAPVIGVEVWASAATGKKASADAQSAALVKRAIMLMVRSLPTGASKPAHEEATAEGGFSAMLHRFVSIGVAAIIAGSLVVIASASAHDPSALPDCQGKLQVRPSSIVFACGDGGVYATGVQWSKWGTLSATATATMHANDCEPNCAQGHFHTYAAIIVVSGTLRCSNGATAYREIAYVPRSQGYPTARTKLDWMQLQC